MPELGDIQPVVLAGGKSRRFGRDKLREPWAGERGGEWLIDRPIAALREVFGRRVWVVGDCAPEVAARGDRHVPDAYPGQGPLGGVLTALERSGLQVFVLGGDLPAIDARTLRSILDAAAEVPEVEAVLAAAPGLEPCVGLYRSGARAILRSALDRGELALHRALAERGVVKVPIEPRAVRNVNTQDDLRQP